MAEVWQHWEVVLGGGIGWRLRIAAGVLGSGDGGRRTCNNGISVSTVKAKGQGLTITMLISASARMAREDTSDGRDVRWQQWQGDRRIAAAVVVAAVQIRG
jgi:hypothetical protein